MKLYQINTSKGTPYLMMSTGGKLVMNKAPQKHRTAALQSREEDAKMISRTGMDSLQKKLGELSLKGRGELKRKKYISLS